MPAMPCQRKTLMLRSPAMKSTPSQTACKFADFRPLRGWRYHTGRVSMNDVIAPPYDVISPQKQMNLYDRSPFNCIRLILNKPEAGDHENSNVYTRAKSFYEEWKKQSVLIQEHAESYYLYEQIFHDPETFELKTRRAILGRLKLEPFDKSVVIPHEKTLSKAREDRKRLLETVHSNFSPIFGLYEDIEGEIRAMIEVCLEHPPLFEAEDDEGVRHVLWAINETSQIDKLHQALSAKRIYIADGHHRYQVSLEHAQRERLAQGNPKHELFSDFTLMALVEFHDSGLILMPTHRMILPFEGWDPAKALEEIKKYFDVEVINEDELLRRIQRQSSGSVKPGSRNLEYGWMMRNKKCYWLSLRKFSDAASRMPQGRAGVWYELDTAVLSHFVLQHLCGLDEPRWEAMIRYSHSHHEAVDRVKKGEFASAFLLRAPRVEVLRDMGKAGELMPQKSTYFWPKLASGLVFYSHES